MTIFLNKHSSQDKERQQAQIGIMVEFAIALIGKLDGINRHSFNSFRLRVGECAQLLGSFSRNLSLMNTALNVFQLTQWVTLVTLSRK